MKPLFWTFCLLLLSSFLYAQQPHILWITIEDTSPQFIACYGNKDASTPVIDELAKEGVRFTNAFSTGTVCSPSRSTIITGARTYAMGTGNHRSNYPVPDFIKGFPYYLKQAQYYVTNNSKTDYNVANEKAFIEEAWNESSNEAGWWNRQEGQPFFSIFNYNDSHQSRTMTNPYEWYRKEVYEQLPAEDRIEEDEFDMPPFYHDSPEMRKQFARVYNSIKLTDNKIGELLNRLKADQLMDSTIIFLYADHGEGIPRGKTNGINLGYRVPFIIWFPPMYEHLSPWGTATVSEELLSFEDLAPTIISLAGAEVPEHMKGRVLIGEDRDKPVDQLFLSSDRSDNGIDMVRTVTDGRYVYSRNYMPYMPEARYIRYMEIGDIKQQMRTDLKANKLNELQQSLFEERPAEFLYDIESDLWEINNLTENKAHQKRLQRMRQSLETNILKQKDVLFLPEYEIGLLSQTTTPYTFRQSASDYPLKEIYAAASLSGHRGENIMKKQLKLLKHSNKIVRYWAAMGLRSQSKELLKECKAQLTEAMVDDYPPVAVTAAAIVYDHFSTPKAIEILKSFCKKENNNLTLMAINYLLYVDKPEPFVETVREVKDNKDVNYNVSAASKDFLGRLGIIPNTFEYK